MENPVAVTPATVHLDQIGQIAIKVDDLACSGIFTRRHLAWSFSLVAAGGLVALRRFHARNDVRAVLESNADGPLRQPLPPLP